MGKILQVLAIIALALSGNAWAASGSDGVYATGSYQNDGKQAGVQDNLSRWYAGASIGKNTVNLNGIVKTNSTATDLTLGYIASENATGKIAVQLDIFDGGSYRTLTNTGKQTGVSTTLVWGVKMGEASELYMKLGLAATTVSNNRTSLRYVKATEGLGFKYGLNKQLALGVEYNRYNFNDEVWGGAHSGVVSGGVTYRF